MEQTPKPKCLARQAGIFYTLVAFGAIGIMIVPAKIFVLNDTAATFQNLQSHEGLFRLGIFTNILCQLAFLMVGIKLYQLFGQVSRGLSLILLGTVIASIPVAFQLIFYQADALHILQLAHLSPSEWESSAYFSLTQFNTGLHIIGYFWGLWLLPFGALAIRSGYIPKVIGYLLIAGGTTYMVDASTFLLIPAYQPITEILNGILSSLAEVSAIGWLLIKGVRKAALPLNQGA